MKGLRLFSICFVFLTTKVYGDEGHNAIVNKVGSDAKSLERKSSTIRNDRVLHRMKETEWIQVGRDIRGTETSEELGKSVSISADGSRVAISAGIYVKVYEKVLDAENEDSWIQLGNTMEDAILPTAHPVALSSDGMSVVIGSPGSAFVPGFARVYRLSETSWVQVGTDIIGEATGDNCGNSVSISDNGSVVAVASSNYGGLDEFGQVRIFSVGSDQWQSMGSLTGGTKLDLFGRSVSLSGDGSRIAIGFNGAPTGKCARVYDNSGIFWNQVGNDIEGDTSAYVSLSKDGNVLAVGTPETNTNTGSARVFEYDGTAWTQVGDEFNGTALGMPWFSYFGFSISMSHDGKRVALGAYKWFGGIVYIYERLDDASSSSWVQVGDRFGGAEVGNQNGISVSLSQDGSYVASAEKYYHRSNHGRVRIFDSVSLTLSPSSAPSFSSSHFPSILPSNIPSVSPSNKPSISSSSLPTTSSPIAPVTTNSPTATVITNNPPTISNSSRPSSIPVFESTSPTADSDNCKGKENLIVTLLKTLLS